MVAGRTTGAAAVAVPVGTRVAALPQTAAMVTVADGVYYVDSGVYYQQCADGYCVVADPTAQSNSNNNGY